MSRMTPTPRLQAAPAAIQGARQWRPGALVSGTVAVHAGAAAAIVAQPASLPWAAGGVIASHLLLTAAGLWPRSNWLGPNLRRLPPSAQGCVALSFDDGPNPEVTPRVLDLLDQHCVQATFFCIGARAAQHPALVREIVQRGHVVENHSQDHRHHFSLFGPARQMRDIATAQQVLTELTGTAPRFFRAPAGLRNPFLEPVLCRLGLHLASWTRRGFDTTAAGDADHVARRLLTGLAERDILLLHDGNPGHDRAGRPLVLEVLPRVLRAIDSAGLRCVTLRDAA
ncbi:polysaccharide deacetylase [Burkholderiaceae bacterium 16]|nr:polysaccharide deacetylase [Burkholderiaceae bacterium 16]